MTGSPLKIAYLSGPANARQIYREWSGKEHQDYIGTDYMKQFLQLASDLGAQSYVVTWFGHKRERYQLGDFTFDNRPITNARGLRYYLKQFAWHLNVLFRLLRERPDVLLLTGNQNFWWVLSPLLLTRTRVVGSYHAVLWPKLTPRSAAQRAMTWLNGRTVLRHASAILVTSRDIRRQLEHVLGKPACRPDILEHLPTYSPEQFAGIRAPTPSDGRPFRVMFLGRIVENKGVFDIVEMARELEGKSPGSFRFDVCGDGPDLANLRDRIRSYGLDQVVICHGFCGQAEARPLLNDSDICIVPTRTDCEAGFEMTCAESILAGRPLVASKVCPALEYLADAAMEAEPDNPRSYCEAILKLSSDAELYQRKRSACEVLQAQFYDARNSWYTIMREALELHVLPATQERRIGRKSETAAHLAS
jgi:glycosyltransferase involved in cell wall biosynthesis